jgi:ABC-type glycerol-3-phosphate transport system substrate-binding protein
VKEKEMSYKKYKMSRRDFLRLSALGMGSSVLAACGAKATQSPAAEEKPTEVEELPPVEPVTLRYIHWWCEGDAHTETVDWMFSEFQKQNPNIKIDSVCVPSEGPDKVAAECAAGSCPDIINWASIAQAEAGQLLDISEWMMENHDRFIWQPDTIQLKLNDKMYGWSAEFGTVPQIWNIRLLEAAGVSEIPMTWDSVVSAAEKLWANKIAWSSMTWTYGYFNAFLPQIPGVFDAWWNAGKTGVWDVPELREAGVMIGEKLLEVLPFTHPSDAEDDWDAAVALFITEQTASEYNGPWTIGGDLKSEGAAEGLMDVCVAKPWPKAFELGPSLEMDTYTMIGASAAVADDSAKLNAVFKLFDWWIGKEVAQKFISDAQSPLGVTEPITDALAGRLLSEFYSAANDANSYLTGVFTMSKVGDAWNAPIDFVKALHAGKSPEEATDIWIQEMTPAA